MRALFVQSGWPLALFVSSEAAVFLGYQHNDARFHWFLHFFVGTSAALIVMAVLTYWSGRAVRLPLLWLLTGHMIAMFPDILWNFEIVPHRPWMDIFLLHISSHFVPGRNWTWYGVFLLSLAGYFFVRAVVEERMSRSTRGPVGLRKFI